MKNIKINFIIIIVCAAVLALLLIQLFQVAQIYDRKSVSFDKKSKSLVEKIAFIYENQENTNYYLDLISKDENLNYKNILKEEFKNLISPKETVTIKDTSMYKEDKMQKFIIIEGKSYDVLSGTSAEHKVIAKDYRDLKNYLDNKKSNESGDKKTYTVSVQMDEKVVKEIFKKSKWLNEMMLKNFRENIYDSINQRIDLYLLDSIISNQIKSQELPQKYRFNILDENHKPIHFDHATGNYSEKIDTTLSQFYTLYPSNQLEEKVYVNLYFPNKQSFIFKDVLGILIISCSLVLLVALVIFILFKTILFQRNLNSMKNDFISNITHELKTPISTISLACQALNDQDMMGSEVDEVSPYVKMIADENHRLEIMIERILQSSNLEKGMIKLQVESFSLTEIVKENIEIAQQEVTRLGGKLKVSLPDDPLEIIGDKLHSQKAIYNVIDNAVKYCKDYPDIEINLSRQKKFIVLSIKDKGIGISKDQITKIFDKLYRVPTGNIHKVKGFGLGLTYTKSIADLQNWNIEVKSELNAGSEFKIIINN